MTHTTDRNHPDLGWGVDHEPQPQNKAYLVLSEEDRARGFVMPVFRDYVHRAPGCGAVTTMSLPLSETYAAQPEFYGATYCAGCRMHRPVGAEGEFTWLDAAGNDTGIRVGTRG